MVSFHNHLFPTVSFLFPSQRFNIHVLFTIGVLQSKWFLFILLFILFYLYSSVHKKHIFLYVLCLPGLNEQIYWLRFACLWVCPQTLPLPVTCDLYKVEFNHLMTLNPLADMVAVFRKHICQCFFFHSLVFFAFFNVFSTHLSKLNVSYQFLSNARAFFSIVLLARILFWQSYFTL